MFPVSIGGTRITGTGGLDVPADDSVPSVCACGTTLGLTTSFWEPAALIETVKDPYCFPTIGTGMSGMESGFLGGGVSERNEERSTFQQAHYWIFPVWGLLDMFYDFPCLDTQSPDIAYITEIDPLWNDDLLGFILNPEALLFANPVAQMACMADAVEANLFNADYGVSRMLFWCMGSWGSAYPLTGHTPSSDYTQANAALAARMIYKMSREMLMWDTGTNECGAVPLPIWDKAHYRMHLAKPVRDHVCHPIGKSGLIWAAGKNPPWAGDNFLWMLFKKRLCCAGYDFAS